MLTRIFLFLLTNLAVIVVATVVLQLLGFEGVLQSNGVDLDYQGLALFALVLGFAGAFISLLLSKWVAKKTMGVFVLSPYDQALAPGEVFLYKMVDRLSDKAGIKTPEVGIYNSPEINAFATGAFKNRALVAVSSGLLQKMREDEIEGVIAHEIAHIKNGDMVTMTLLQGVVNAFVIFAARVVGHFIDRIVLKNEEGHGIGYFLSVIVLEILFGILASVITMAYSRHREFHADAGGADLAGRDKMVAALRRLQTESGGGLPEQMAAFGISGKVGFLFSSHPPLERRIKRLQEL